MLIGLIGLVAPALMLVYYRTIEGFEQRLIERRLYLVWGGGVIFAVLVTLLEMLFGLRLETGVKNGDAAIIAVVTQPVIHNMILVMALNHPKMRVCKENPFYGAGLGLSFGALYGTLVLFEGEMKDLEWMNLETLPLLVPGLLGLTLFLGAQGAWLGQQTNRKESMTFIARAWGVYALFCLLRFFWFISDDIDLGETTGWAVKFAMGWVLVAIGGFHYLRQYRLTLRPVFVAPPRKRHRRPAPPRG